MYLTIVLIPIISAIAAGLFGRLIGSKGAGMLTTLSIALSSLLS
jgi:NADH:ubiquinone oxidoreductase subunit 5 (subunit L)/multisubunit Na+/H+ antiporter MnhA subunit